jgi:chemotaxis response regulator CheB
MAFAMRQAYTRHLSLSDQHQLRFGRNKFVEEEVEDKDGNIQIVKKMEPVITLVKEKPKTLKERLEAKKKKKEEEKLTVLRVDEKDEKEEKRKDDKRRETKSVKKTATSKDAFSRSASKTKESLKKSAKNKSFGKTPRPKRDESDDVFLIDDDLLDDRKKTIKVKSREEEIADLKQFTVNLNHSLNRGYKHHVSSGLVNFQDVRRGGHFMRNASLLFDTFG